MSNVDIHPRILSLCSGIGGLDLGIGLALPTARAVCFVEREYPVCEVLAARMEQGSIEPAPIHTDLRAFDGRPWRGRVDIVAAGYPCQPFSVAGSRLGEEDERHLWPEVLRIIGEVGPSLVFLENVAGHLRLGFDRVLGDLADLGFDAEWSLVRASDVGAPHRRERLFILAYAENDHRRSRERGEEEGAGSNAERWQRLAGRGAELGDPDSPRPQGWGRSFGGSADQWSAWPPGPEGDWSDVPEHLWPATEPSVRGVADGLPGRVDRLRALGNAVVPQQAAHALRGLLMRAFSNSPTPQNDD